VSVVIENIVYTIDIQEINDNDNTVAVETINYSVIEVNSDLLIKNITGGATYVHNQLSPEAIWHVSHGLGKYPAVNVVDSAGTEFIPKIQYIDQNNVDIISAYSVSGKAYFN